MLKLEHSTSNQKAEQKVEIRLRPKNRIFDRPLQRALLYSFLFHTLLFGLFRIQYNDLNDRDNGPIPPIQVAIDQDYDQEREQTRTLQGAFADPYEEINSSRLALEITPQLAPQADELMKMPHLETKKTIHALLSQPSLLISTNNAPFRDETSNLDRAQAAFLDFSERLYPLHIKLSHAFHKLELMSDGSELFRTKKPTDRTSQFQLTLAHYSITYHVRVLGATGKIVTQSRTKELLDKRLQLLADRLLEHIQFAPFAKEAIEGRLSIIFHAGSHDIEGMLAT